MNAVERYWTFVGLDSAGRYRRKPVPSAKAFFEQAFPQFIEATEIPHAAIQRQLIQWVRSVDDLDISQQAACCLRCFISNETDRICQDLERKFGEAGGFHRFELLLRVLDDVNIQEPIDLVNPDPHRYQPLAAKILQSFNPEQGQLSTWTKRLVVSHPELVDYQRNFA